MTAMIVDGIEVTEADRREVKATTLAEMRQVGIEDGETVADVLVGNIRDGLTPEQVHALHDYATKAIAEKVAKLTLIGCTGKQLKAYRLSAMKGVVKGMDKHAWRFAEPAGRA